MLALQPGACGMNFRHELGWAVLGAALISGLAAATDRPAAWSQPQAPFRIVGDIYYVGSKGLAAYLIASPQGDILLDGTLEENAPMIESNIEALGFRLRDVKILLNSHAHFDHAAGLARLKADTGARMMSSAGDRWALEHGTSRGDTTYGTTTYPAVKVDKVVADGQTVRIGPISMTAMITPGHTPGCTSWSTPAYEQGRILKVVFPCSLTVAGNVLVGNRAYPDIAADYRRSLARLQAVKADVVLTAHPEFADVLQHRQRVLAGDRQAFVDPQQLTRLVASAKVDFAKEVAKQSAKAHETASQQS